MAQLSAGRHKYTLTHTSACQPSSCGRPVMGAHQTLRSGSASQCEEMSYISREAWRQKKKENAAKHWLMLLECDHVGKQR